MNNQQYIKALEKALKSLDSQTRIDIVAELQSHIAELGSHESLEVRFGSVDVLAQEYLRGERVSQPVTAKVAIISRRVLSWLGIAVLIIALLIGVAFWWWSGDAFDYANEDSPELVDSNAQWQVVSLGEPIGLIIDQSQTALYWHEKPSIKLNCKRKINNLTSGKLEIQRNSCLAFLPNQKVYINASKSSVVLVRPLSNVDIKVEQGKLRIAENSAKYRYSLETDQSHTDEFISHADAKVGITIDAKQSSVTHYKYR
ncbi:MAG: hypothetical protein GY694_01110 [Gammaproteobacteria bacterium]|nr:hypothetical protein [Gammaproteobacteria bacterium]